MLGWGTEICPLHSSRPPPTSPGAAAAASSRVSSVQANTAAAGERGQSAASERTLAQPGRGRGGSVCLWGLQSKLRLNCQPAWRVSAWIDPLLRQSLSRLPVACGAKGMTLSGQPPVPAPPRSRAPFATGLEKLPEATREASGAGNRDAPAGIPRHPKAGRGAAASPPGPGLRLRLFSLSAGAPALPPPTRSAPAGLMLERRAPGGDDPRS